jgi:imidazolonepropionase-like amidohydrolase
VIRRILCCTVSALLVLACLVSPLGHAAVSGQGRSAQRPASVVAVKGATILTVTHGTIPNGTIVLRDGKIAAVGASASIPSGADVIDAAGRFVSPGIIDCHSHIAADSINEMGTTVSSMTGIEDVLNPGDINIYRNLAGGLTTANVLHGSANPIGGKNTVIKLRWGKPRAEELVFEGALPGIKFALGENPKRPGGGAGGRQGPGPVRYPATRMGVEYVIRDAFTRAKAYQREWQEYERRKRAGEDVVPPRRDLQLEPLVEVLEGKRLVHAHSYRADEILMLMRLADEFSFKIATFQHVLEGYKVAKEIAAHGAGASTFSDWWGYKIEAVDAIPYNAALMTRKGVLVSVNSDSAEHARRLNTEAAKSMHWGGLSEDEALALVTINPAKQLRIDNRVGSLEVGKDADVVIWNHHPLSSYAIADRVYIDGRLYYDRSTEEKRLTEVQKEKASLVAAEGGAKGTPATSLPDEGTRLSSDGNGGAGSDVPTSFAQDVRPTHDGSGRASGFGSNRTRQATTSVAQATTSVAQRIAATTSPNAVLAITNARIFPVTQPPIERGTIVIRNGRIDALGANVSAPAGATIIDAAGQDVYPGWISPRSTIGLSDPGAGGYADSNEMLDFNPQLRPTVAFHNDSEAIPVARANGVTTVGVMPGGGVLGGQAAVMNLDGWTWEESTVKPSVGVTFQFPTLRPTQGFEGGGRGSAQADRSYDDLKKDRDRKLDELARLLDRARAYVAAAGPSRQTDWVLDALVPIVERREPFFVHADKDNDIRDAVAFADRAKVKIVIVGGLEAPFVSALLKEKGVPVILGPVLTLPTREDASHAATYQAAGELVRAGVKIAFTAGGAGDSANLRQLPYNAAESVAWGLSRDEAVKALTINAAEILGVGDEIGSLEPGKMANLFVAKGDPLEVRTEITRVIINGRDVSLMNKQLALYQRYMGRP